tara:strand:- start:1474 stop:1941 length:468 start_codon:yes stop_codon:yes gene_type:complete
MDELPFFVYGTLLPEQPNYYLWKDSIEKMIPARIKDCQLFDMGHYPMLVQNEGKYVEGMLMYINSDDFGSVIKRIDNLEGYSPENHGNSAYNREMLDIEFNNGKVEKAWVYLGSIEFISNEKIVESGKWVNHISEKKENMDWWKDTPTVAGLHEK